MPARHPRWAEAIRRIAAAAAAALIIIGAAHAEPPAAPSGEIKILYLSAPHPPPAIRPLFETIPDNEAVAGARLAIDDNNGTGQFLGQRFRLEEVKSDDAPAAAEDAHPLVVADLPAAKLLQLADLPAMREAAILDIATSDDALRQGSCRANMLHVLPSRAMLADALMQYLSVKAWRRIVLLAGREAPDRLLADAVRTSAKKFRIAIAADRDWTFNPAAQQADTGHFQVNTEVADATAGAEYDVLVVADEAGNFGNSLSYRAKQPRPVAGTQGLTPTAWSYVFDEYGSTQLQNRFQRSAGRRMTARDYAGWLAVRAIGEAATRSGTTDPAAVAAYLRREDFSLAGYKGAPLSFRPWDGQLRQPVLLVDTRSLVSISPQPGFLHQYNNLDTLGVDRPESACKPESR